MYLIDEEQEMLLFTTSGPLLLRLLESLPFPPYQTLTNPLWLGWLAFDKTPEMTAFVADPW